MFTFTLLITFHTVLPPRDQQDIVSLKMSIKNTLVQSNGKHVFFNFTLQIFIQKEKVMGGSQSMVQLLKVSNM